MSVIVPVWNGHERLCAAVAELRAFLERQPYRAELIVVDDHSDPPVEAALRRAAVLDSNGVTERVIESHAPHGKGGAVAVGALSARGDYRIFMDADQAYPAAEISKLLAALRDGSDVAIACRLLPESTYVMSPSFFSYLYTRHLMSRAFNVLTRHALVPGILDTQAGLKGFTAAAAERIFPQLTINGFAFDVECLYIARVEGLRVAQVPVTFQYDSEPSTVSFVRDAARMLRDLARVRWNAWRHRYA